MKYCRVNNGNKKTCLNCDAFIPQGSLDLGGCGQSENDDVGNHVMGRCKLRPEIGLFEPTISFDDCPCWEKDGDEYKLVED